MAGKLDQPDVQSFLTLLLSLTAFPGLPGRDENISEVCHTLAHVHQAAYIV